MCCCGRPTINGEPGAYSWDGHWFTTHQLAPPTLEEYDTLIFDEPGRCGGIDAHSHHFRLVKSRGNYAVLVRHGGGEERVGLSCTFGLLAPSLNALTSDARFWLLHTLYSLHGETKRNTQTARDSIWRQAAAEKRIKVRKLRNRLAVEVSIAPKAQPPLPITA